MPRPAPTRKRRSRTGAQLLGVVERRSNDDRRDPLLMAVELAHLDGRADLGALDGDPAESDVLPQDRRARAARDHTDLGAPDVHAIAVPRGLVALELEPDERALGMRAPLEQSITADEVVLLVGGDGEADAGLEGIDLVVELVAREDQTRLDPQHVERVEPEWRDPVRGPRVHDRVVERGRVLRVAEELVAELAR